MALDAHLEPPGKQGNRRSSSRRALRLETSGSLPGGAEANVLVHNLSAAGLLIETDLSLEIGDTLAVELPEVGPVGAEIVWRSGRLHGCAFQQALGEAALSASQLRSAPVEPDSTKDRRAADPQAFPSMRSTLGERIGRIRRERGLTLSQIADALNVSKPTVWAWEKDKARPLPERMRAIAEALGVEIAQLQESQGNNANADLVEECRIRIATAYDTAPSRIRIMIEV